nr:hypothetical protein [Tanacetum cinerariifolium]
MNHGLLDVLNVKSLIMRMRVIHLGLRRCVHIRYQARVEPVSKLSTINENHSMPNSNAPPVSKEDVNGAAKPNLSHKVPMNDSSCSTNENGYFKDGIDLGQLQSNIEKLMDEDK